MICTFYSHYVAFDKIIEIARRFFPGASISSSKADESSVIDIEIKGGLFKAAQKLQIRNRQRSVPSYQIPEIDDSPLTGNLKGLYGYIGSLPASNEKIRELMLQKVLTLNSEFSLSNEQGNIKELKGFIKELALEFDAILFTQPGTVISKANGQHFLNKDLNLLLDTEGNGEADELPVNIESVYFDGEQAEITEDQKIRKATSEKLLEQYAVKINRSLPHIESEQETTIRAAKEIAQRVTVLAITNLVAFNSIESKEAIEYLKEFHIWDYVTAGEKDFLDNPTAERKNHETWKCEDIWVLLWALKKVDKLGWPNEPCNLSDIPPENYPVAQNKNPNQFIDSITDLRSKEEILDAADLYYRLDWACVDARINNKEITEVHPGIVYERHYALNWLINYMGQDWDHISCDT